MPLHSTVPVAAAGPLAGGVCLLGLVAGAVWVGWRFGPTLARVAGWCAWWVAWACGSEGGYGYCAVFAVLGALAWGGGTVWYARRRGRWPSAVSARLLELLLGGRGLLTRFELPAVVIVPRRR